MYFIESSILCMDALFDDDWNLIEERKYWSERDYNESTFTDFLAEYGYEPCGVKSGHEFIPESIRNKYCTSLYRTVVDVSS